MESLGTPVMQINNNSSTSVFVLRGWGPREVGVCEVNANFYFYLINPKSLGIRNLFTPHCQWEMRNQREKLAGGGNHPSIDQLCK